MRWRRSAGRAGPIALPSPGVVLGPELVRRLGLFAARFHAARERREGGGKAALQGIGTEFVAYRPYRPGEDLRQLDWGLFARLRRPFVRVARREASERWVVLCDTSASMGVGVPGKLQCAAEVAAALATCGARAGASVVVACSGGGELELRRRGALGALLRFLEGRRAEGERGLAALLCEPARLRGAGRVFALGDLFDVEPDDLLRLGGRARELACAQILAPEELVPDAGPVEWVDAEGAGRMEVAVDARVRALYEERLSRRLERWRGACARHGVPYRCFTSATPFERVVLALLAS